jgi:ABC-type transporter Mla MlaB component
MISVSGPLDLRLAKPLWQISDAGRGAYTSYILDLSRVDEVFDSGLACLLMFVRRVARGGAGVLVVNADSGSARAGAGARLNRLLGRGPAWRAFAC